MASAVRWVWFTMDADFRRAEGKDSGRWVAGLRRRQALSAACPQSRVVNICDREGDFRALLDAARQSGAELLVRASRSAPRHVLLPEDSSGCLWLHMGGQPVLGHRKIRLAASGGVRRRKTRTVRLALRAAYVDLKPPVKVGGPPLRMLAVSAREVRRRKQKLSWLLLTTGRSSADIETAIEVVRFYKLRWRIERFFHALKVGTRIEDRRLDDADDLGKCLAFDAITAFRVWDLSLLAPEKPDDPAARYVNGDEIKFLTLMARKSGFSCGTGTAGDDHREICGADSGTGGVSCIETAAIAGDAETVAGVADPVHRDVCCSKST